MRRWAARAARRGTHVRAWRGKRGASGGSEREASAPASQLRSSRGRAAARSRRRAARRADERSVRGAAARRTAGGGAPEQEAAPGAPEQHAARARACRAAGSTPWRTWGLGRRRKKGEGHKATNASLVCARTRRCQNAAWRFEWHLSNTRATCAWLTSRAACLRRWLARAAAARCPWAQRSARLSGTPTWACRPQPPWTPRSPAGGAPSRR